MKFRKITWEELEKNCFTLAKKLKNIDVQEIIAISRGGLVQGRILSDILGLPMANIAITFYKGIKRLDSPIITQTLPDGYTCKNILLVDGISDSGKTFNEALKYLKTQAIDKVYTASVYIKPETSFVPDYWMERTKEWIIFPYEIKETQKMFGEMYSRIEALIKLRELGFQDWEIDPF